MKRTAILLFSVICFSCSQKNEQPYTDKIVENYVRNQMKLSKHNADKILFISYRITYQAKNSAGVLDTGNSLVSYFPADSTFKVDKLIK